MARKTKEQRLAEIHAEAIAEFDDIQSKVQEERYQCLKDRRFYSIAGAQWEGDLADQFENKPKFEVNKIHLSVIRIINEYRNNRITVDFVDKDEADDTDLAETCDGLYRADEEDSCAEEAYDNAFEEAVGGGFGAWRLTTEYEDEEDPEDERQRIRIEPIYDADSCVFFDLNAKRQDKSDAKRCFVLTSMSPAAYSEEWGDEPDSWDKNITECEFDWATDDAVYVAEYYRVESVRHTVHIYQMLDGSEERYSEEELETDEMLVKTLEAKGARKVREKKTRKQRVRKYIMSGGRVLEDCGYLAGKHIPIVPVYGKRWFVDNIERCMGHVRLSKDVQRLKNMQLSRLGEISALSTVEKPIFTSEQIAGHETIWAEDNIKNYPYLTINAITDAEGNEMPAGPVGYTKPPQIPPAMAALLQITEQDMKDLLGNQEAGEEIQPNLSGKAVELIQNRLDMQTFIYMSNMAKAVKRSGEIWLSMARDILVESGRRMKVIGRQDEVDRIELYQPSMDKNGGKVILNDLSKAKFDVWVDVGPSSSSKRAATVRALTGMMQITADPETKQVLGAMAMMNMEGEGISEVREYFRKKLIRMGVVEPTEQEAKELQEELANQKPSAQDEYFRAAAASEEAKGVKAMADAMHTQAETDKTRAETVEILTETELAKLKQAMETIEKLGPRVDIQASQLQQGSTQELT